MTWVWIWVAVAIVILVAVAVMLFVKDPLQPRRAARTEDEAIAARSRYHQLGHYVDDSVVNHEHVDDEDAAALLRTARERWLSSGALLARAVTEADFGHAERVAVEGLRAVADAHQRLGRSGPTLPV